MTIIRPSLPLSGLAPDTELIRATMDDFDDVLCVLSDAARWLRDKGIEDQWPPVFEETDWRAEKLRHEIGKGNTWLLRWTSPTATRVFPLATVTITDWADPDFARGWPDGPENALYIMRLATTQLARNLGLRVGPWLFEHAVMLAGIRVGETGVEHRVRLDCSKRNTALHAYYERLGFKRVGTVNVPGRRSGALFEWRYDVNWRAHA